MLAAEYENDPLALSVSEPCDGPATRTAVMVAESMSESFVNTPGAATFSAVSSEVE